MNEDQQDSFELFADTLTITLACIIFIALLLVTITRSHQIDQSGLLHIQRRSELLEQQIRLAHLAVTTAEEELRMQIKSDQQAPSKLAAYRQSALDQIDAVLKKFEPAYADALLAENRRAGLFTTKLPWISQTVESNNSSLKTRIERTFSKASQEAIALSVLREQAQSANEPIYWIIHAGRHYPVAGGPGQNYAHVDWKRTDKYNNNSGETIWQLTPKPSGGLDSKNSLNYLSELATGLTRESKRQIVLLVYADSFLEARILLTELSSMNINFSWRPLQQNQRILMSESGLPPKATF
jgi:hypothetical protein